MDFGKLTNIEGIDFRLPDTPEETASVLQKADLRVGKPRVYIGCTGWAMKEWVGKVYPRAAKPAEYLKWYGKQFNTIELNTTHYRTPTISMIEEWRYQTPKDFKFCPKILQTISHSKNFGYGTGLTKLFCEAIAGLEDKLGTTFMQLPPYFDHSQISNLEGYLDRFPRSIPLAVEVRHEEWFNNKRFGKAFFQLLENHKVGTVITDVSGRRDVLHQRLTTPTAMVRFVGNGLHQTDFSRIDEWVLRLKEWFEFGLHEVYFFTHEPDNLLGPELAKYLYDQVIATFDAEVRGPNFLKDTTEQISLF